MTNLLNSSNICKEGNTFYLDTEDYQDNLGMKICHGELIKFTYDNQQYTAKTQIVHGTKDLFILKNVKELVI